AGRAALDPSGGVDPSHGLVGVRLEHTSRLVQDHAPAVVKRYARQRDAAIAHRAENEPDGQRLEVIRRLCLKRARRRRLETVSDQTERRHSPGWVAADLDW